MAMDLGRCRVVTWTCDQTCLWDSLASREKSCTLTLGHSSVSNTWYGKIERDGVLISNASVESSHTGSTA